MGRTASHAYNHWLSRFKGSVMDELWAEGAVQDLKKKDQHLD